jgi:hypothetical protein
MRERHVALVNIRAFVGDLIRLATILLPIVLAACDGDGGGGPAY